MKISWKIREEVSPVSLSSGWDKGVETIRKVVVGIWVNMVYIVGENYIPVSKEGYTSPMKGSKLIEVRIIRFLLESC